MNLSLIKIREYFPHFNLTTVTENDVWRHAKKHKIIVKEMPLPIDGYYKRVGTKHFILLDSKLSPRRRWLTLLHEFCHFLFDDPNEADNYALYRGKGHSDRRERRADAFALIAMFPLSELAQISHEDLINNKELANLVMDRFYVYGDLGM